MMHDQDSRADRVLRNAIALSFGGFGLTMGMFLVFSSVFRVVFPRANIWMTVAFLAALTGLMLTAGYITGPFLITRARSLLVWWEEKLIKIPAADLFGAILGLIIGLIIAFFIGNPLSSIPIFGRFLPTIVSIFLGYLGASLGMKKRDEVFQTFGRMRNIAIRERKKDIVFDEETGLFIDSLPEASDYMEKLRSGSAPKILDTSVIIDGRIADVFKTGFLDGTVIVPSFVLLELQRIADSSDGLRRNRGRRGLDILNTMRKEMGEDVQVIEASLPDVQEVDSKLVALAKQMDGEILTNDYNLNKVAELQGIRVLNINDLVNALKQVYLPGEEMIVHVFKEGKEKNQGIGYLDDGTMIVVEDGRKYMNHSICTIVTSVLQTSAGRMIFVKPKYTDGRVYAKSEA